MVNLIAAIAILGTSPLTLNQRIDEHQMKRKIIGTSLDAERAKNWENRVYLATYPRSGNHWLRYLIEEATGIASGSVYIDPDPQHMTSVFPWGGYCIDGGYEGQCRYPMEGEIAVVKTHFPALYSISWFDKLPYKKTIRMIRHPVDSFYSYYVWEQNHKKLKIEYIIPKEKILVYLRKWRRFQEYWDSAENVLTIRYEDFYLDPASYLKLILETIGYKVSDEDIERAVKRYPPIGGLLKHLDHFTDEELFLIETELNDLMDLYGYELRNCQELK